MGPRPGPSAKNTAAVFSPAAASRSIQIKHFKIIVGAAAVLLVLRRRSRSHSAPAARPLALWLGRAACCVGAPCGPRAHRLSFTGLSSRRLPLPSRRVPGRRTPRVSPRRLRENAVLPPLPRSSAGLFLPPRSLAVAYPPLFPLSAVLPLSGVLPPRRLALAADSRSGCLVFVTSPHGRAALLRGTSLRRAACDCP